MKAHPRWVIFFPAFIVVTFALLISSCGKDDPTNGPISGDTTIRGIVNRADTTGNPPIANASVRIGTGTPVLTSSTGEFTIGVEPGANATLTVSKAGYSFNEVVVNVARGVTKNVTVSLLAEGAKKTFAVTAKDSIADGSYKLTLPPNFVSGTGNVTVSITGLDPTTGEIRALPGGLEATDAQGATKYLLPVSFAEYVARDANGNVLQVNQSAGSGANIELPIPASLRGQPGYRNGDPIECYLYDAVTGKWKTPVPGIVGPSSVDGQPAIKATIFHLSWYGGAPALTARSCIRGYVRNANGTPAAGADVEAFAGGNATTDAQGFYQVDAAPNSNVRVVGTAVQGTTVRWGEVLVFTGGTQDTCRVAPDITLGAAQQGSFKVDAFLLKSGEGGQSFDFGLANIKLVTPAGAASNWDNAIVKVGTGTQMTTMPSTGGGGYTLTSPSLTLAAGQTYSVTVDFDNNQTIDANGQIRMVGTPVITFPDSGSSVGSSFTATWTDAGTGTSGYSASYWLFLSGDSLSEFFLTKNLAKVIGNGTVDSSFYGFPQPNGPLPAGNYSINVWSLNGPAGFLTIGLPQPNINGQNVEGFFYAYALGEPVDFSSTGIPGSAFRLAVKKQQMPVALKRMYNQLPAKIREKFGLKTERGTL